MNDAPEVTFDAPASKPAKKKQSRKRRASKPKVTALGPKASAQFEGMTKTECADGCKATACVVSGKPYCAHPCKGGLQAADQNDLPAMKRLQAARAHLGVKVDPNRFADA